MDIRKLDEIVARIKGIKKEKVLVKIDGRGGSGKSTLSLLLKNMLPNSAQINLDEYTTGDFELFSKQSIDKGFAVDFQNVVYDEEKVSILIESSPCKYIIIEGCFSFKNTPSILADYKIWVDIDKEVAANRLYNREINDKVHKSLPMDLILLSTKMWQISEDKYIGSFYPERFADTIYPN